MEEQYRKEIAWWFAELGVMVEQKKQANELIERQMKASRDMLDGIKDFGDVDFYR